MFALPCTCNDRQGAAVVEGRHQACARQPGLEVAERRHFVITQTPTTWFACPLLEATKVDRPFFFIQHPLLHIACLIRLLNSNPGSVFSSVSCTYWVTHRERHKQQRVPSAEQTAPASASCQIALDSSTRHPTAVYKLEYHWSYAFNTTVRYLELR
ncbi:hypothetical protein BU25DRAFT_25577 [Macroventuria anomochaeta]|uniref:Uncharacterized protein n=1 Tax=Macroventuria anomochaeta TaxID=301207 RepID=A0ACB6S433_9PLEO|nr:uncharacterized protein BU25DRAFT_25577 [Macroventuria anomochaeta]KAF2629015.1 hypothetical protein BU25DRAFT_25577 [Macroventuria anomochaeta]